MSIDRRITGARGEEQAVAYLRDHGYEILDRNWRCARGELDIIAADGVELVFVEVRARQGSTLGTPEESITHAKQHRLRLLALLYLQDRSDQGDPWHGPWRIDVIAVRHPGREQAEINHIPYAIEGAH